jgi:hypothetical protein
MLRKRPAITQVSGIRRARAVVAGDTSLITPCYARRSAGGRAAIP